MPAIPKGHRQVALTIPENVYEKLRRLSFERRIPQTKLYRSALERFLKKEGAKK